MKGPGNSLKGWLDAHSVATRGLITSYLVDVTPAIAAAWLKLNTGNRKPSAAKVHRFADLIRAGKWLVNGESVKFSASGRLIDGQSRLRAIVEAGIAAPLEVRAGIADEAQRAMDCGESRRATHTLEMLGHEHPAVLSPALRLAFKLEHGGLGSGGGHGRMGVMENLAIPSILARHADLTRSVAWAVDLGSRMRKYMPLSEAAFFHYIFAGGGLQQRDSFFDGLRSGNGMSQPVAMLRQRILDAPNGRLAAGIRIKLIVKAWNAHARHRPLPALVLAPRESCAPIHGATGQPARGGDPGRLHMIETILKDAAR
jgi:hypothetical protein